MDLNRRTSLRPPNSSKRFSGAGRRTSLVCKMPSDYGCTVLPALASLDSLLPSENQAIVEVDSPISQISPRSTIRLEELEATWHIVLLGRTFENYTPEQVAQTLMQELLMDADAARKKARAASAVKAFVLETSKFCSDASLKAEALRKKGLSISITSQSGLPASTSDVTLAKPVVRRASYFELFRKAGSEFVRPRRNSISTSSPKASDLLELTKVNDVSVVAEDAVGALWKSDQEEVLPAKTPTLKDLIFKNKAKLAEEAASNDEGESPSRRKPSKDATPKSKKESRKEKIISMWDNVLDFVESETLDRKNTPARKEACELIRFMIFGEVFQSEDHRYYMLHLNIGSIEDIRIMMPFWALMDVDRSGRVDLGDFRRYGERRLKWQFLEKEGECSFSPLLTCSKEDRYDKFITGLIDKISTHLFGKKSSMSLDDIMKLIWLRATKIDLKTMKAWCKEAIREPGTMRVPAPPVLSNTEYKDLVSIFTHFDTERTGHLSFEQLVAVGLLHEYQIPQAKKDWDTDGNGTLEEQEFCEMMCPIGFRARANSLVGTRKDGTRVTYDEGLAGWRLESEPQPVNMTAFSATDRKGSKSSVLDRYESNDSMVSSTLPTGFGLSERSDIS